MSSIFLPRISLDGKIDVLFNKVDVFFNKNIGAIVFNDSNLSVVEVENMTIDEIDRLEISPLLDWLDEVDRLGGHVTIELNGSDPDIMRGLAKVAYNTIAHETNLDYYMIAVQSSHIEAMGCYASLQANDHADDRVALGLTSENIPQWLMGLNRAQVMGMNFISVQHDMCTPKFLATAQDYNLEVCAWFVDNVERARELADQGVYVLTKSQEVYEALKETD